MDGQPIICIQSPAFSLHIFRIHHSPELSGSAADKDVSQENLRLKIQALTDYEAGTTVNVGICQGGTKVNVVSAAASFSVDCRYKSMEEGQRIRREILELPISVPGASREVEIVEGKLPMEETQGNMELFAAAKECGRKLGLSFSHQFVGGGSDGNAVSAMGIPTLDGLGGWGDGAHSESEYLRISQYIPRIALLASLILDIR